MNPPRKIYKLYTFCKICQKEYKVYVSELLRGRGNHCSSICAKATLIRKTKSRTLSESA